MTELRTFQILSLGISKSIYIGGITFMIFTHGTNFIVKLYWAFLYIFFFYFLIGENTFFSVESMITFLFLFIVIVFKIYKEE